MHIFFGNAFSCLGNRKGLCRVREMVGRKLATELLLDCPLLVSSLAPRMPNIHTWAAGRRHSAQLAGWAHRERKVCWLKSGWEGPARSFVGNTFQLMASGSKSSVLMGFLVVVVFGTVRKRQELIMLLGRGVRFPGLLGRCLHWIWR